MENNKNNIYNYEQTLRGGQAHATRVTSLLQGKQQDTTASRGHAQNWACSSYAMARKSAMKWNSFAGTHGYADNTMQEMRQVVSKAKRCKMLFRNKQPLVC